MQRYEHMFLYSQNISAVNLEVNNVNKKKVLFINFVLKIKSCRVTEISE